MINVKKSQEIKNMGQTGPGSLRVELDERQLEFIGFVPSQGHFEPLSGKPVEFVVGRTRWGNDPHPRVLRNNKVLEDLLVEVRVFNNKPHDTETFHEGTKIYTPQEGDLIYRGWYAGPSGDRFVEKVQLVSAGWQITFVN